MKYIVVLGDGMADEPIDMLGGRTPLQAAETPYMDMLAREGRSGLLGTVPDGFAPGSEIANLSVLGYDVAKVFEGRGSLEAASMGVDIADGEMAMRCNLITIVDGKIKNHSAGHISNAEAHELVEYLQQELGDEQVDFFSGVSYRHLVKVKNGDKHLVCYPPHDHVGEEAESLRIEAAKKSAEDTAEMLNRLTVRARKLLENHPVNLKRVSEGKDPANSIWLWSPGYRPKMEPLSQKYAQIKSGSVISAVDLIKGIGKYAGLESIDVEGATGLFDTNYEGKAWAAIEALRKQDFVFLHIEASDEAGHEGDVGLKIRTIEYLDQRVLKPLIEEVATWEEPVAIALLPDHPTPCRTKKHSKAPVPFTIWNPELEPDSVQKYDEFAAAEGFYGELEGDQFIDVLINRK